MLSCSDVWDTVNRWRIEMRVTRLRNLALLAYGIIQSRSGCLSVIVRSWPQGPRRHIHRLKRLHRFLKNSSVKPAPVFEALAAIICSYRPAGQRAQLFPVALDWTKLHAFAVLFAAMPRKARAPPWAFGAYHPDRLRHSQNRLERGMCTLVASLLPKAVTPLFLADASLGRTESIRWLRQQGFGFAIHLRPDTLVRYRRCAVPLSHVHRIEGAPITLSNVEY